MQKDRLDKIDIEILSLLSRDCRLSNIKIGSNIGLTKNSVKTRIKRMISLGIFQYIVDVNPIIFGYKMNFFFIIKHTKADKDIIRLLHQSGVLLCEAQSADGLYVFSLALKEEDEQKIRKLINFLDDALIEYFSLNQSNRYNIDLKEYELKIIKCLMVNPKIIIKNIAEITSVSSKTVNRIINKFRETQVLRFSIVSNPNYIKGYIEFGIRIYIEKGPYAFEKVYDILRDYSFLGTPLISKYNAIFIILLIEDIVTLNQFLKKVGSIKGVNGIGLDILTSFIIHQEWVINEIEKGIA